MANITGIFNNSVKKQQARDWATMRDTSTALANLKEDVRLLPRTNAVKRLRSITFMLVQLDRQGNETGILATHTLLIAPQGYQQAEPNRSVVVQTLGGAFIDDWGLGLKQITISGTTGYAKRIVHETSMETTNPGQQSMVATDGYHAFKALRDDVYRQYFDLDKKSVTGATDLSGSLDRNSSIAQGQRAGGMLSGGFATGWQDMADTAAINSANIAQRNKSREKPKPAVSASLSNSRLSG